MTFDETLHVYSFLPGLSDARMLVISDMEEPFVPLSPETLCVDVQAPNVRAQMQQLLTQTLPYLFSEAASDDSAGNAALKVATSLLGLRGGGHVIMFHATLPNRGLGALRNRDDIRLYGTPEEPSLWAPQQPAFFEDMAVDVIAKGVAVSCFLAPMTGTYIDVASLSVLPRRTGGDICFYPSFDLSRDGEKLHYDIARTAAQSAVYSVVFKLRVSRGLSVDSVYATWEPDVVDRSSFQISRLSNDATVDFVMSHTERMEGAKNWYAQAACLYTDVHGRRLIRVHTLTLPVTTSLSNIFRYTEIDTVTNLLIKQAALAQISGAGRFKEHLQKACVDMMHSYRINCASTTAAGQLILPESLKLLPLYVGSILKMPAFRQGSDVRADERVACLVRLLGLPIALTGPLVYPRVLPLAKGGQMPERVGLPTHVGENVHLPSTVACSVDRFATDGMYLIDNGVSMHLYLMAEMSPEFLWKTFEVGTLLEVPAAFSRLEVGKGSGEAEDYSTRLLRVIQQIRSDRGRQPWIPFTVIVPGTPQEPKLLSLLCEDRLAGELNYVDFLCHIHKLVQHKLD